MTTKLASAGIRRAAAGRFYYRKRSSVGSRSKLATHPRMRSRAVTNWHIVNAQAATLFLGFESCPAGVLMVVNCIHTIEVLARNDISAATMRISSEVGCLVSNSSGTSVISVVRAVSPAQHKMAAAPSLIIGRVGHSVCTRRWSRMPAIQLREAQRGMQPKRTTSRMQHQYAPAHWYDPTIIVTPLSGRHIFSV